LFTVDENDSGMVDTPSSSQDSRERCMCVFSGLLV